jgi:hypothetical protein
MALKMNGIWLFAPPQNMQAIPIEAINEFWELVLKVGSQSDSWKNLELFKREFASVLGRVSFSSTNELWAVTDLREVMKETAGNPPLFVQALHSGFEYSNRKLGLVVPDDGLINDILFRYNIPLRIEGGALKLTKETGPAVSVPPPPPTLSEAAAAILHDSIRRSEHLLNEGRGREAVQELLWVLESLMTGFKGSTFNGEKVNGKYFNMIVCELKGVTGNTTLKRALEWCNQLHGFLSSPTGGKVRHGLDIKNMSTLPPEEARLFCNLIKSYVAFFQDEYHKAHGGSQPPAK